MAEGQSEVAESAEEVEELAALWAEKVRLHREREALRETRCVIQSCWVDLRREAKLLEREAADSASKQRVVTAPLAATRVLLLPLPPLVLR